MKAVETPDVGTFDRDLALSTGQEEVGGAVAAITGGGAVFADDAGKAVGAACSRAKRWRGGDGEDGSSANQMLSLP